MQDAIPVKNHMVMCKMDVMQLVLLQNVLNVSQTLRNVRDAYLNTNV